jgi:hypothetical protein
MLHMIAEEDAGRFGGFHWAVARQGVCERPAEWWGLRVAGAAS